MLDAIGKRYVVETGQTENGWFTRYSDGWIEQGGVLAGTGGTITFPIAFSNTNFSFVHAKTTSYNRDGTGYGSDAFSAWDKTTTTVTVLSSSNWNKDWIACGY